MDLGVGRAQRQATPVVAVATAARFRGTGVLGLGAAAAVPCRRPVGLGLDDPLGYGQSPQCGLAADRLADTAEAERSKAPPTCVLAVGPVGLEPTTRGLKVRCSAN